MRTGAAPSPASPPGEGSRRPPAGAAAEGRGSLTATAAIRTAILLLPGAVHPQPASSCRRFRSPRCVARGRAGRRRPIPAATAGSSRCRGRAGTGRCHPGGGMRVRVCVSVCCGVAAVGPAGSSSPLFAPAFCPRVACEREGSASTCVSAGPGPWPAVTRRSSRDSGARQLLGGFPVRVCRMGGDRCSPGRVGAGFALGDASPPMARVSRSIQLHLNSRQVTTS